MQIGWIDYSKDERSKILSILTQLGTQEALDELGIGSVRDAFSDMLFPGISVLQTRAKYFVLIPYLFEDAKKRVMSEKLRNGREVREYIENCETKIVLPLLRNSGWSTTGIIGRNSLSDKGVQTKPSSIYWNGLRTLGILNSSSFSIDNACGAIYSKGARYTKTERKYETSESGSDDSDIYRDGFVVFNAIPPKYDFMREASITLTKEEAEFLRGRIVHSFGTKDSALAYMLENSYLLEKYEKFEDFDYTAFLGDLSDRVRLARAFSDFIFGAHLLYNIIFAEGCGVETDEVDELRKDFVLYMNTYSSPPIQEILNRVHAKPKISEFIKSFDRAMCAQDITKAKNIVVLRELEVKRKRSKLNKPKEFQFEKPIHHFKLQYRYGTARRILMDICEGLEVENG